jgi:hypothetical protein
VKTGLLEREGGEFFSKEVKANAKEGEEKG